MLKFGLTHSVAVTRRMAPAGVLAGALALAMPAHALLIVPTFDASITGSPNAAAIEGSINTAIATIDGLYNNSISVPVDFTYKPVSGNDLLGTNQFYAAVGYSTYIGLLTGDAAANPANTILPTALSNLSTGNNASGSQQMALSSALYAMLTGTAAPSIGSGQAPVININSNQTFGYTQPVSSGVYDLTGGLEHELDEVLGGGGAGSTLNAIGGSCTTNPGGFFCNKYGPLDLYRYSAFDTPSFSATSENNPISYFSVDSGVTNIVYFNQNQGGDMADFAGNVADGGTNQCGTVLAGGLGGQLIQNAFNCTGPDEAYTTASPEYVMEESIGWDPTSAPEPMSLACILPGALALAGVRRRRRRNAKAG
jgi:hypothetical protein